MAGTHLRRTMLDDVVTMFIRSTQMNMASMLGTYLISIQICSSSEAVKESRSDGRESIENAADWLGELMNIAPVNNPEHCRSENVIYRQPRLRMLGNAHSISPSLGYMCPSANGN